jgi:hypothetical protein
VTISLSARFGEEGSVGRWSIIDGSGVLSGVRGAGDVVGTSVPGGIRDIYTGIVTVIQ